MTWLSNIAPINAAGRGALGLVNQLIFRDDSEPVLAALLANPVAHQGGTADA